MKLDFIIDVVCPWCFVGKRALDEALGLMTAEKPEIMFRPYQLSSATPAEGVDREEYYRKKFGDGPETHTMRQALRERGQALGIAFDFESPCRIANSLDAHRVIRWAVSDGVQAQVADNIMSRYFEHCEFIGDHDLLVDVAQRAGMDGALVRDLLASDQDKELITMEADNARQMGVQGVPFYLFDGRAAISGAQDTPVLAQAMDRVAAGQV
ncbi:DSBA oxidoreductase [Kordiimonas sediminis]|uniref:DSBA oxidoreductase n=1 Tax=Kordiimonas sediminis TaxID=1735581 RepID=A0A919ATD8_9PROT|nr:DsbA family oxidoreductase [Kordiimonas sediminis]GHF25120.1 DSBA oxidoreductase [Kordiimonas sediminis]